MDSLNEMQDWQRAKLDSCLIEISKDLDIRDTILKLRVRNIINADDEQLIMNDSIHKIDSEKRQKIVEIVKTRGERAYWGFCHIVRSKTPFLFNFLHVCQEEDDEVENVCPECKGEDSLLNCCNNCSGLLNVLSNPEFEIYVEKPEEIVEAFQSMHKVKDALSTEVKMHIAENEKLNKNYQQLLESKLLLAQQLEDKEKEFARIDEEVTKIKMEKEESNIEKEKIYFTNEELKRKLTLVLSDADSRQGLNREEPIYANSDVIEQLKFDFTNLDVSRTSSMSTNSSTSSDSSAIFKLKYETLEEVLKKQKHEHDRVFTSLENKLRLSDLSVRQSKEELKAHKDYIKVINNEKEEAIREKSFLLKKLREKDKSLKEAQNNLNKMKQDKSSFETTIAELEKINKELSQQVRRVSQISGQEGATKHAVENDENYNTTSYNTLQQYRLEEELKQMKNKNSNKDYEYCRPSDTNVVLKKIGDIFGVKFNVKKGLLLFGESRIFISSINYNHLVTTQDSDPVEAKNWLKYIHKGYNVNEIQHIRTTSSQV